jgi:hypothetical protein
MKKNRTLKISWYLKLVLLLIPIIIFQASITSLAQDFPDICQQPENILPNCTFDRGLEGWHSFLEAGSAHFGYLQGGGECHAPLCPAAHIVSEDHFIGGIYQQIPVAKGNNYYANIVWLVFDSLVNDKAAHAATGGIGRRIGIDPFGGTDSRSPNVVWSEDNWRNDCKICNVEHVTVTAQADTITVFLRIDNTWKLRAREKGFPLPPSKDQFWLDDIGLKQVGGEAIAVQAPTEVPPTDTPEPTPTDTPPAPPTDTPVAEPPTPPSPADTLTPENEPTEEIEEPQQFAAEANEPTAEVLVAQAVSPVETPTAASIDAPAAPPTLTPTPVQSPTPTATRRPRATLALVSQQRFQVAGESSPTELPVMMGAVGASICMGGAAMLMVGLIMGGLVWIYRVGCGKKYKKVFTFDAVF